MSECGLAAPPMLNFLKELNFFKMEKCYLTNLSKNHTFNSKKMERNICQAITF